MLSHNPLPFTFSFPTSTPPIPPLPAQHTHHFPSDPSLPKHSPTSTPISLTILHNFFHLSFYFYIRPIHTFPSLIPLPPQPLLPLLGKTVRLMCMQLNLYGFLPGSTEPLNQGRLGTATWPGKNVSNGSTENWFNCVPSHEYLLKWLVNLKKRVFRLNP